MGSGKGYNYLCFDTRIGVVVHGKGARRRGSRPDGLRVFNHLARAIGERNRGDRHNRMYFQSADSPRRPGEPQTRAIRVEKPNSAIRASSELGRPIRQCTTNHVRKPGGCPPGLQAGGWLGLGATSEPHTSSYEVAGRERS